MRGENFKIAIQSVRSQMLRTLITAAIIAIGIMALVGILTAIDAIKNSLNGQFSLLGANTFSIQNRGTGIRIGRGGKQPEVYDHISFFQARQFKERFQNPQILCSITDRVSGIARIQYQNQKTDPNVSLMGVDENYLKAGGYELAAGRFITSDDVGQAASVALLGADVRNKLFAEKAQVLGELVQIKGKRYRVIGLLQAKGSSLGMSPDNVVLIPYTNARSWFTGSKAGYSLNVISLLAENLEANASEATALMRSVRRLSPQKENDFYIIKSDSLSQTLIEQLDSVTIAAIIIALITLLGAAIALMNIMLVSVTERTREIGVRKAIGAKAAVIRNQFLTEAVVICLLGGVAGIVLGIAIGNATSLIIGGAFIIPWLWMLVGVAVCIAVGLVSGFYPAYKASRLDPIDSLRYE